ncbi:hypothetical protein [Aminobacter sp. HY435]|uniref:hypothetical protein n=1 Tax=Aminobacter sp. HY435 TaxID=2970917 RepID=UPI0022B9618D|nr:hypothetical protein [Aminobacter sp. HY435]
MAGVAKSSFRPQTLGAMVVALVVYVFASFTAATLVTIAASMLAPVIDWLLFGARPNLVQLAGAVAAAVAGIVAARLVCDLAFKNYSRRLVFAMFAVVLTMTTLGDASMTFTTAQMILGLQYLAALAAAYFCFWRVQPPAQEHLGRGDILDGENG